METPALAEPHMKGPHPTIPQAMMDNTQVTQADSRIVDPDLPPIQEDQKDSDTEDPAVTDHPAPADLEEDLAVALEADPE